MAIVYGEYGPYDDATGMPVFNAGGESGTNWMTVGNESVASVPVGPTTAPAPDSSYIVRGNYRMPKAPFGAAGASGALEVRDANGNWVPVTAETAPAGYDYRQDSNTQGSNERLRFDQAFGTAPADVPITNLQQWAMANGWTEPDRSNNEGTLGSMFSNIAPYAGLMLGGIGAMGGLSGLLGSAGSGALAAGDAMAGAIPAGELGAWTGAGAAGTTAGSGAMDWSNLGDLWNSGGSSSGWDFGPLSDSFMSGGVDPVSGMSLTQSMVPSGWDFGPLSDSLMNGGTDPVSGMTLNQMGPGWLDTLKSALSSGGSNATSALKSLLGGAAGSGSTDLMRLLGGLGAAGLGAYASSKQTSALDDMAKRYEGYGAPYRQKLSDLYANPSSFLTSPEVKTSVDQGTNSLMRSLSTSGNPFGSGNALQQGQSYASDQLFGKLGQEKDRLANFGGLSTYNSAAPVVAKDAISSSMGGYRAAGDAMGNIFNPPQTQAQTMADFFRMMGK